MSEKDYKDLAKESIELCEVMLKELYYAKVNDLMYDQLDVAIFKLKTRFNGEED